MLYSPSGPARWQTSCRDGCSSRRPRSWTCLRRARRSAQVWTLSWHGRNRRSVSVAARARGRTVGRSRIQSRPARRHTPFFRCPVARLRASTAHTAVPYIIGIGRTSARWVADEPAHGHPVCIGVGRVGTTMPREAPTGPANTLHIWVTLPWAQLWTHCLEKNTCGIMVATTQLRTLPLFGRACFPKHIRLATHLACSCGLAISLPRHPLHSFPRPHPHPHTHCSCLGQQRPPRGTGPLHRS